jgi:hypothetical protein
VQPPVRIGPRRAVKRREAHAEASAEPDQALSAREEPSSRMDARSSHRSPLTTLCRRTSLNNRWVPRLSAFYGIVIYMYRPDHPPPHFHAQYGEHVAQIALGSLEVLSGSLPPRALRLVREWAGLHADELAANWDLAQALEPLVPVEPLA